MAQESWNREKEETGCRVPEGLILCANNCGLFGSPATLNLCSKCYRDLQLQKASPEDSNSKGAFAASASSSSSQVGVYVEEEKAGPSLAVATEKAPLNEAAVIKQTTNRCSSCRKRVGLTGFRCRCGHMFCGIHRYSDKHGCTFDYKAFAREAIAKANPVVKADKVIRF